MPIAPYTPLNNAGTFLVADHVIGDGELQVDDVNAFGSPTPSSPIKVVAITGGQLVIMSITGKDATTVTIGGFLEGTSDIGLPSGTTVYNALTAGDIEDIYTAMGDAGVTIGNPVAGSTNSTVLFTDSSGELNNNNNLGWNNSTNTLNVTGTVVATTFTGPGAGITGVVHTTGDESVQGKKTFLGDNVGAGNDRWVIRSDDDIDLVKVDKYGCIVVEATDFEIGGTTAISNVELTSNVATITTDDPHGYRPGYIVTISGLTTTDLNGDYVVVTTPTPDTFTFTKAHADIASTSDSGTVVSTQVAPMQVFKDSSGEIRSYFNHRGGLHLGVQLPGASPRWGDHASLSIHQNNMGQVAFGIYDSNFLFNETATKTNLSLQTYFLDDGSYYSGRSFIVSQDRNKLTGEISQMGGQTMVGASCDINAPAFKAANQLNLVGEKYRYCYAAIDAADVHPLYPAGGVYSDRGFGKTKWVVGPCGETLWGTYLNPDGDSSDPEEHRLAKMWLNTTTGNLTVEGSGQTATTTTFDIFGPTGGNSILRLGSRNNQNAFWIGTSASTTGFANVNLGSQTILRMYDNPGSLPGASVSIGVDDNTSALTVDGAANNASVAVATFRAKNGQLAPVIRVHDKDWNTMWQIAANGKMGANFELPTGQVHVMSSTTTTVTSVFQAMASQTANLTDWKDSGGASIAAMTVAGRLGLGTTTPTALLEVKKGSGGTIASFGANATSDLFTIGYEQAGTIAGSLDLTSSAFGPMVLNSQSNNHILLLPNGVGKVGVNETSPTAVFQVKSNSAGSAVVIVKGASSQTANLQEWRDNSNIVHALISPSGYMRIGTGSSSGDSNAGLEVCYGADSASYVSGSGFPAFKVLSTTNNVIGKFQALGSANYCYLGTETDHALKIITNNTSRLSVTNGGLIGINVDASTAQLEIVTSSTTTKGLIVKGIASQTGSLQEWHNSSGMVGGISPAGAATFSGGAILATAALATTATAGFTYLSTCAGTPTGTPIAKTGTAPIIIDSTNDKLYFYSGGAWVDSTAGGGGGSLGPTLTALETTAFAADDATTTFDLGSAGHIRWSSTSVASGTKDVGLKRTGAGELAITDGGSGIGNLEVDELVVGTLSGMIKATSGTLAAATEGTDYLSGASNKLPLPYSFGGAGVPSVANDVTPWVYVSHDATVVRLTLSCKVAPSGNFQVTIKRSSDSGSTFPDTVATVTVSSGGKLSTTTSITGASLSAGDYLRCDVISVNGADTWSARLETLSKNV